MINFVQYLNWKNEIDNSCDIIIIVDILYIMRCIIFFVSSTMISRNFIKNFFIKLNPIKNDVLPLSSLFIFYCFSVRLNSVCLNVF